jgi:GH15 family glucan-1,4-alpha-glucosidase
MAQRIEDYALLGNGSTAGLVGRNGSIDWLAFPRFDSGACFAALLGCDENGYWKIAPQDANPQVRRAYRPGTLVLETEFTTETGVVMLTDCMDQKGAEHHVIRVLRGVSGRVEMNLELAIRFEYGSIVPWVSRLDDGRLRAVAGPEQITLQAPVPLRGEGLTTCANFSIDQDQEIAFVLTWASSFGRTPPAIDVHSAMANVSRAWEKWSKQHKNHGRWSEAVLRSLITLKALTHHGTGGIVAAATTSLPEEIGGERNWDYRFCWLRDSTFTLYALMEAGFADEAKAWREWLLRAVAGSPDQMQIMYGVAGERRLTEYEIDWLEGYERSKPIRIGNAASTQLQLDVYGEVLDSQYLARKVGLAPLEAAWNLERALVRHVEAIWDQPDDGIWEVRGDRRQFTHSKVMAWVAVDRAVCSMQEFSLDGPLDRWISLRERIHDEVCRSGFDRDMVSFVQYFGGKELDASLLMLPLVGFLKPDDPRIKGTVAAIEKNLLVDGFVARYDTAACVDGVRGSEGAFLPCSFWLADNYVLQNRHEEACELFERLLSVRNDVGLLSEEYDPKAKRQLGNFPQAFSHLALVNTAHNLEGATKPARHRSGHPHRK